MSTSKLQRRVSELLSTHLAQYTIRENHRPEWLEGLELDFFLEEIETAIEVQGEQHYQYVELFHKTHYAFDAQKIRDAKKRRLCLDRGVILYEIFSIEDCITLIENFTGIEIDQSTHPRAVEQVRRWQEQDLRKRTDMLFAKVRRLRRYRLARSYLKTIISERASVHPRPDRIAKYEKRLSVTLLTQRGTARDLAVQVLKNDFGNAATVVLDTLGIQ